MLELKEHTLKTPMFGENLNWDSNWIAKYMWSGFVMIQALKNQTKMVPFLLINQTLITYICLVFSISDLKAYQVHKMLLSCSETGVCIYLQVMINFCMAAKEYEKTHELSTAMILVCIFHFVYVADCLLYEVSEDGSSIQQNLLRVYLQMYFLTEKYIFSLSS